MVTKGPHPEGEPWVLLADVLAEAAGMAASRTYAEAAEAQARAMRAVRHDWCGRPTITWSAAAELLASLRAEQARVLAEAEQRVVAAADAHLAAIPKGIPAGMVPEGMSGATLMMALDPEARKARRQSVVEHALQNGGEAVYHPVTGDAP
jgi:hypothetical protein